MSSSFKVNRDCVSILPTNTSRLCRRLYMFVMLLTLDAGSEDNARNPVNDNAHTHSTGGLRKLDQALPYAFYSHPLHILNKHPVAQCDRWTGINQP